MRSITSKGTYRGAAVTLVSVLIVWLLVTMCIIYGLSAWYLFLIIPIVIINNCILAYVLMHDDSSSGSYNGGYATGGLGDADNSATNVAAWREAVAANPQNSAELAVKYGVTDPTILANS
jgi:hypothetical protein